MTSTTCERLIGVPSETLDVLLADLRIRVLSHAHRKHRRERLLAGRDLVDQGLRSARVFDLPGFPRAKRLAVRTPGHRSQHVKAPRLREAVIGRLDRQIEQAFNLVAPDGAVGELADGSAGPDRVEGVHECHSRVSGEPGPRICTDRGGDAVRAEYGGEARSVQMQVANRMPLPRRPRDEASQSPVAGRPARRFK